MKKHLIIGLFLMTVLHTACNKEDALLQNPPNQANNDSRKSASPFYTVANGVCIISSLDNLNAFLEDTIRLDSLEELMIAELNATANYVTYSSFFFTPDYMGSLTGDDLVAAESDRNELIYNITNQDRVVKIGGYFILVNTEDALMYVREDDTPSAYDELVNQTTSHPQNKKISFEHDLNDVIAYLDASGYVWDEADFQGIFKRGCPAAPGKISTKYLYNIGNAGAPSYSTIHIGVLSRYQNFGVYGRLYSESRTFTPTNAGINWTKQNHVNPYWYQKRCKSKSSSKSHVAQGNQSFGYFKKTYYSSVNKLEHYYCKVRARSTHPNSNQQWTAYAIVGH